MVKAPSRDILTSSPGSLVVDKQADTGGQAKNQRSLIQRVRRLRRDILGSRKVIVYALELTNSPVAFIQPHCEVQFRINCREDLKVLQSGQSPCELEPQLARQIPRQLAEGELCITGWVKEEMVFYGWIQFKYRRLARFTTVPMAERTAFVYRCFTRPDYRGRRIYPAALSFSYRWLAEHGYTKVMVDHATDNIASQRGILRSGMKPTGQYQLYWLFGIQWARYDQTLQKQISG